MSNAIQDKMLVSYKDLISLCIIPGGFPNTIIQKCREVTRIEPKEMLLEEYPDVLSDALSPEPMKTDSPMHIHIKEGATPRKVTTARCVPLRYECEAEKTVQEPIEKGVIVPANETSSVQFTLSVAQRKSYKLFPRTLRYSPSWTPYTDISSWDWTKKAAKLQPSYYLRGNLDISEPPWV